MTRPILSYIPPTLEERFWAKVDKRSENECWPWLGACTGTHGVIWREGKNAGAHVVSYNLHFGDFDPVLWVLHRCDNGLCVNPKHLFLGTPKINTQDMLSKGRGGDMRFNNNVLKVREVVMIRGLLAEGVKARDIAGLFSVSRQNINDIAARRTWNTVGAGA